MKRLLILLIACSVGSLTYAQKKPKIAQAEKARKEGRLGDAKNIIDRASEYEKIKDDGKTWYYRGLIYSTLDTTSNPEFQNLSDNPLEEAMKAFSKADELEKGNSGYYITNASGIPELKSNQIQGLWGYYLNKGVEQFQAENYTDALASFEKTQIIQPKDTTGYIYAGSVALAGKDYEAAKRNYNKLLNEIDYHPRDAYNTLIFIAASVEKNDEEALKIIRQAKSHFPDDIEYAKSEINALIRLKKIDEAKAEIESAIEKEPSNPNLYFTLGVMQEEIGNKDEAAAAYQKAIDADGTYYNAVFNLAVLNYNTAVELIKEKNNLGITAADLKKAKGMNEAIQTSLKNALPHWEKANELQENDRTTLETLEYIYFNLKMNDKAEAVGTKLETLKEEGGE